MEFQRLNTLSIHKNLMECLNCFFPQFILLKNSNEILFSQCVYLLKFSMIFLMEMYTSKSNEMSTVSSTKSHHDVNPSNNSIKLFAKKFIDVLKWIRWIEKRSISIKELVLVSEAFGILKRSWINVFLKIMPNTIQEMSVLYGGVVYITIQHINHRLVKVKRKKSIVNSIACHWIHIQSLPNFSKRFSAFNLFVVYNL